MNNKFFQIAGPFNANEELIDKIKVEAGYDLTFIKKVGIQIPSFPSSAHLISINGQIFEIGKTNILEFNEVEITSLFFLQNEIEFAIIDLIIEG